MKRLGTSYGLSKGPLVAQLRSPILEVHALDLESFTKKAKVFRQKQQNLLALDCRGRVLLMIGYDLNQQRGGSMLRFSQYSSGYLGVVDSQLGLWFVCLWT